MPRSRTSARRIAFEPLEQRTLLDANALALPERLDMAAGISGGELSFLVTPATAEVADLLPDLTALASEAEGWIYGWSLDTSELTGRKLLRLTTATGNLGDGALEIRGGEVLPDGQQRVYQRIYNDMGGFRVVEAGTFTYHPSHGHTHFDDFAQYHLREVTVGNGVGDIIVSGDKTSFCLLDSQPIEPGAAPAQYLTCTTTRQGITPGWADVYHQSLPDQWIDITDVQDGTYWLEVVADPDNHILEADESNNVERILIELGTPNVDRFEVNNSFATATDLGLVGNRVEADLSIHESADEDFYKLTAGDDGNIDISIFFAHAQGDMDVALYDGAEKFVDDSTSFDNMEQIMVAAAAGETYYLRVYGVTGDTNLYDLSIKGPLLGDFNGDDSVGSADYVIWRKTENTNVTPYSGADGNGDGVIDHDDYDVWHSNFGRSAPAGSGSKNTELAQEGTPQLPPPGAASASTFAIRTGDAAVSATYRAVPNYRRGDLLVDQLHSMSKIAKAELAGSASMDAAEYSKKTGDKIIMSLAAALDQVFDSFMLD